jgi:hypothetical protein
MLIQDWYKELCLIARKKIKKKNYETRENTGQS